MACMIEPIPPGMNCDGTYKCLTVLQPFASLIECGKKTIETRTWSTSYRGPLVIHAGVRIHKGELVIAGSMRASAKLMAETNPRLYPLGVVVCLVDLVNVRPMVFEDERAAMCELYEGAFAWELKNPRILRPKKVKGQLGIWNIEAKIVQLDFT